ncbi:1238_t:CDS:2 [Entrophospora sp. SA101]|nr:7069_t:CDS:2 [Entrophospora sp. SA101]CAJ0825700.1 1238_t:CDS:2 [Entrophospora sp. SA101]CAJ0840999.1 6113_t:CDS:2 [Entrophospora sp. SA101]
MAIAPTATTANIAGCYPCIEAMYNTLDQLKYYSGSIQNIPTIPQPLKEKYRGVFELDPETLGASQIEKSTLDAGKFGYTQKRENISIESPACSLSNEDFEKHLPVMPTEALSYLNIKKNGIYLDCTLGRGGHSQVLLEHCPQIKIIAFDQDQEAIERCQQNPFFANKKIVFINDNFINFSQHLTKLNIFQVDGFLFDLGISSEQLNDDSRGFSYRQDAPLDMRMSTENNHHQLTAQKIINNYNCRELAKIFFEYGEEKKAKKIAWRICQIRKKEKIATTQQLVSIVASCFSQKSDKHPARRIFQALRIAVNQELINLSQGLETALQKLKIGGRIVVISYHSLEDRIVKQLFKKSSELGHYQILTKKPLNPTDEEIANNRRARSAKMRAISRLN